MVNMWNRLAATVICVLAGTWPGVGTAHTSPDPDADTAIPAEMKSASTEAFVARFDVTPDTDRDSWDSEWYVSDFKNRKSSFYNVNWSRKNVIARPGQVTLKLKQRGGTKRHDKSGELIRRGRFGYGRYEVVMKPAVGSGLVSSFFTHTGPYFGDPHDEIDIEFLGADTTNIHFNHFRDGRRIHPKIIPLGFDAAEGFHTYAFEWHPDRVEWFVDGQLVHVQTEDVPRTPGRILINLWTGKKGLYEWHGAPDFPSEVTAEYRCLSFRPAGSMAPTCSSDS